MFKVIVRVCVLFTFTGTGVFAEQSTIPHGTTDAHQIVAGAVDLMRGETSYTEMSMLVHRPDWQRSSSLVGWTRGRQDALIRFTAPAKDAGNATLKQGEKMWTYTPKLNRTIRLPFSLMSQSWAGSDFSYNDLSRTDKLLHDYDLTLDQVVDSEGGHRIYFITAVPHEDAPVVWGKEEMIIRDDFVLMSQTYFDQALEPLKKMETLEIREMGGRMIASKMRMAKLDEPDNYTEISYDVADFGVQVDDQLFTLFALKSGGRG
ncbi:MAG: outer membrane lipoprotein-sorting protein [Pseudomonadales bacterium]|nr:outer membrane lipoprotein-sorting protein [Pseudomonadales bacterium]MDP6471917.1 outer membrane lipoprotein-sorting protein [Pseudomonadales bacterium]MDP6826813.1 outer membrane lipoprotein-sorting protein [Pseudomonadales bacterium]MDP6970909.1 outer membrane lipoprotein-sorting protein [Pseudomonadales bacterium]